MFYFLTNPYLIANGILIASAALPALLLMYLVYRADRLEKESPQLIKALARAGVLSSLLALVEERVLSLLLDSVLPEGSILYSFLLYFVIVACAEESSKYLFMKRETWN
ncbi:MAG: protease PrsW, partial [Clostridia bacterium]|nr:protease PrsW [Clostridia bacterium]